LSYIHLDTCLNTIKISFQHVLFYPDTETQLLASIKKMSRLSQQGSQKVESKNGGEQFLKVPILSGKVLRYLFISPLIVTFTQLFRNESF